jgi:hypothetical protein
MIEFEKIIYLDVYKTGSTHVFDVLKKATGKRPQRVSRHSPLTEVHPWRWKNGKFVFATIRNPWDWYVSLWAFGTHEDKSFYQNVCDAAGEDMAGRLYDHANPQVSFPLWLKSILDPDFIARMKGKTLATSGMAEVMGVYSYRFMRITTPFPSILLRRWNIGSIDRAIAYQKRWATYDAIYRSEQLDAALERLISERGEALGFRADALKFVRRGEKQRTNMSTRTLSSYRDYYTDDLAELVRQRDRMIVDMFDYRF